MIPVINNWTLALGICQEMAASHQPNDNSPTGFWLTNQPTSPVLATTIVTGWRQQNIIDYSNLPPQTAAMGGWDSVLVFTGGVAWGICAFDLMVHNGTSLDAIATMVNGLGPNDILAQQPGIPSHDSLMAAMKAIGYTSNDPFANWVAAPAQPLGDIQAIVQTVLTPYDGITITLPIDATTPQYLQACANVANLFGQS